MSVRNPLISERSELSAAGLAQTAEGVKALIQVPETFRDELHLSKEFFGVRFQWN